MRRSLRRSDRLERLEQRVAKTEERLERQAQRLTRQRELLDRVRPAAHRAHALFEILSAQIGAMEDRLQRLTDQIELGRLESTDADQVQARALVDEIREEHRRIRVRFGVLTRYEERIRRLESALAEEVAAAAELAREAAMNGSVRDAPTHGAVDVPEDAPPGMLRAPTEVTPPGGT